MLNSFAVLSAVVAVAVAQASLPTGISSACTEYLEGLNNNAALTTCTTALNEALAPFARGANSTPTAAQRTAALRETCSAEVDEACPQDLFTSQLLEFHAACGEELTTNPNPTVITFYDSLYIASPMRFATCAKGDDGRTCTTSGNTLTQDAANRLQTSLVTEANGLNAGAFNDNYIAFLLSSPAMSAEELCTPCTSSIVRNYLAYEAMVPYSPGSSNSQLIRSQADLFRAVNEKCGSDFTNVEVAAAGGVKTGFNFDRTDDESPAAALEVPLQALVGVVAGFLTLGVAAL